MYIAWSIVSKLMIGLVALLAVVRVLGRKSLAQMTPYDFVYTLVLGGCLRKRYMMTKSIYSMSS
ncbi:hypothetical protein ACTQ5J_09355 [Fundicoccus sp. Sow4_F4]|uniref:hypothetical protein n=1 Tax=Fundicoccus sp. Sow4_F4 TaxID=3438783 RepID=UPI003F8E40DC